jgi:hypothetical protein
MRNNLKKWRDVGISGRVAVMSFGILARICAALMGQAK